MRSELSFLMDLFLNDEVPPPIKKMVADRIREVEETLTQQPVPRGPFPVVVASVPGVPKQAPSMQRIMEANPDILPPPPITPGAAAAIQARAKLIQNAANEKPEPGRTSPRKF